MFIKRNSDGFVFNDMSVDQNTWTNKYDPTTHTIATQAEFDAIHNPPPTDDQKAEEVRRLRDVFIESTDWIVTKYTELGQPIPADWAAYRQALRDIPQQAGFPWSVTWPTKPTSKP